MGVSREHRSLCFLPPYSVTDLLVPNIGLKGPRVGLILNPGSSRRTPGSAERVQGFCFERFKEFGIKAGSFHSPCQVHCH